MLTSKWHYVKVQAESFHLNGHIIRFRLQTEKLESPYKTPLSTLAMKGLTKLLRCMIYTDIISFFSSYTIGTPFALLTLQMMKTHISLKRRNNKGSTLSCSLHRRRNLTSVSNVCEAVPRSLFYFRSPTDSTNYRKGVSNFLLI